MQTEVEDVKEVIEEDIWGTLLDFFDIILFSFETREEEIEITVGLILLVIAVFLVTGLVLRGVRLFLTRKLESPDKRKFTSVFKFIKHLVYVIVVLVTMHAIGVDITILLTASAALFVGVGLALQGFFQGIIGGLFIITDKSLLVGDVIELNGKVGRVIDIKLRTTRLLTRDDKVMIIPNHKFISDVIFNFTQNHSTTREFVKVGVAYGSDTEKVEEILLESVRDQTGIADRPEPFVLFDDFGDSALIFSIHFYVIDSFVDPKVKSQVRFKIDKMFRESGVVVPFPQRDVHLFQQPPPSGAEE